MKIMSSNDLAPVVLFVYNRPKHTRDTLESLSKCSLCESTEIYIFSDAAKNQAAVTLVDEVRSIIKDDIWRKSFKMITVIEAKKNKGLANSVIEGVTRIISKYGKIIVVEDDNIVAEDFLDYMNRGLDYYNKNSKIGYLGAYTMPIDIPSDYNHDVFIMGRGSSYAWATWKDRWELVDWEVKDYKSFRYNLFKRWKFNRYGNDRSRMLDSQMAGRIDSWAIRFSYALFKNNLYAILPVKTRVVNNGFDGTGVHNKNGTTKFLTHIEGDLKQVVFEDVLLDEGLRKAFYKKLSVEPFLIRVLRKIKKIVNIGKKSD